MSRALVVPFHRYPPDYKDNHLLLFEFFKKELKLWGSEFSKLYFIDSQFYLSDRAKEELVELRPEVQIISTHNVSHAESLKRGVMDVVEPYVGIIDMDTFIYRPNIVNKYFTMLEHHEVEIAAMIEAPERGRISRFAPYFTFANMETIRSLGDPDFDPHPEEGHLDPLAKLTHDLVRRGARYYNAPDDRSTIQMFGDGKIRTLRMYQYGSGAYHARNFNGGIHLADMYRVSRDDFERQIALMPPEEVTRIFGWNTLLAHKTGTHQELIETIREIVTRWFTLDQWDGYMKEFLKFHQYMDI